VSVAVFYFSFRSPYSWLGYRDLLADHPDVATTLDWRPFWEPEPELMRQLAACGESFPYVDMSRAKALYILQDVRRLARRRGLALRWPVDRRPRWEVAHLAYLAARSLGAGPQFIDAIYRARWEQGRDISDPVVVGALGGDLGLDPHFLATAADHPPLRTEGLEALRAIARDGVFGVPFFIADREKFWGVDRLADFVAALPTKTALPTVDGLVALGAAADLGHAGGCG
jgi:2-hydroxychromene-2-carboxylate isomerase